MTHCPTDMSHFPHPHPRWKGLSRRVSGWALLWESPQVLKHYKISNNQHLEGGGKILEKNLGWISFEPGKRRFKLLNSKPVGCYFYSTQ